MVDLNKFVEVKLKQEDDFLKVRETLTRIGVSSRKDKILYQSCHILHKQGNIILYTSKNYSNWMANQPILQRMIFKEEMQLQDYWKNGVW